MYPRRLLALQRLNERVITWQRGFHERICCCTAAGKSRDKRSQKLHITGQLDLQCTEPQHWFQADYERCLYGTSPDFVLLFGMLFSIHFIWQTALCNPNWRTWLCYTLCNVEPV